MLSNKFYLSAGTYSPFFFVYTPRTSCDIEYIYVCFDISPLVLHYVFLTGVSLEKLGFVIKSNHAIDTLMIT